MTHLERSPAARPARVPALATVGWPPDAGRADAGLDEDVFDDDLRLRLEHQNSMLALREPAALRTPRDGRLAVAAAVAYIAALPLLRPSGMFNTSPVDLPGFLLIVVVGLAWLDHRVRMRMSYGLPIAVFALGGVLGAFAGPVPGTGLVAVVQDLVLLLMCGCLATVARTAAAQRLLLRSWAISGLCWAGLLIVGVVAHIDVLSGATSRFGSRATLTTGDPNLAGNYLVVSLFMMYAARWPTRAVQRGLTTAVMVVAVLLTGSNGATVALVIGFVVAVAASICMQQRWRVVAGVVTVAAGTGLFFGMAPVGQWQQNIVSSAQASSVPIVRDSFGRQDQSSSTRHLLLDESLQLFHSDGVLGAGPGSTKPLLESDQYAYQKEAHDDYLAALVERGALGVFGLGLLIGAAVRRLSALVQLHADPTGRRIVAPGAMIGCAVAFAVSGMFYEVLHFRQLWVYLAVLAATSRERAT